VPYLIEALLFLAPFAAFFVWRRLNRRAIWSRGDDRH